MKKFIIGSIKEEKKKGLINSAVTKGLELSSKMKPSGNQWLGYIPENWRVWKFRYFTKILSGYSPEQVSFVESGGIDYFKVEELNNVDDSYRLNSSKWRINPKTVGKINPPNVLMIPKRGGAIGTNKIAVSTDVSCFDTNVMGLLIDEKIADLDFIAYWIKNRNLIEIADTTTIPQINNKHINPLEIALPEIDVQKKIVLYIKGESAKIELAISKIENELTLTEEYKTSIIAEAVTGKIDVRQYDLPYIEVEEYFEEPEEELNIAAEVEAEYKKQEME